MTGFDIEEFLRDENNLDIFDSIRLRKVCNSDEELFWFLGIVTENVKFVNENKNTPWRSSQKVKKVAEGLTTHFKLHFYEILIKLLCNQYDETIASSLDLIYREYLANKEEFKELNEDGWFLPDNTYKLYLEDLENYKSGQGVSYKEGDTTYTNQWALHEKQSKDGVSQGPAEAASINDSETSELSMESKPYPTLTEWQQALVFHYLKKAYRVGEGVDTTLFAKVVSQILNKKPNPRVENTNLYKYLRDPFSKLGDSDRSINSAIKDINTIKSIFLTLGNTKIVDLIDQDINKLQNGRMLG